MESKYLACNNFEQVLQLFFNPDIVTLDKVMEQHATSAKALAPGRFVTPMLALPSTGIDDCLSKDADLLVDFKYDGERVQIHFDKGSVTCFTRTGGKTVSRFPTLDDHLKQYFASQSAIQNCILDAEIVAVDKTSGKLVSFAKLPRSVVCK